MSFVYNVFAYDFCQQLSISCSLNQSADRVIDVTVKWHTFLITMFVLICSFKNKRFLYYCYIYSDMKSNFKYYYNLKRSWFGVSFTLCIISLVVVMWSSSNIHTRKEKKVRGCLCKKDNQTPMTGQDREISDTQG